MIATAKRRGAENSISAVAAAAVVDVVVVIVRDNPSVEGLVLVDVRSRTGPMAESLSGARMGREVSFGLVLGLGFEFFDSESSSLDDLLFLEVLFQLFMFLFSAPPPSVVVAAISAVGFTK